MLFWSFCLLTFVQCVAGLIVRGLDSRAIMSHFDEIVTEHADRKLNYHLNQSTKQTFCDIFCMLH